MQNCHPRVLLAFLFLVNLLSAQTRQLDSLRDVIGKSRQDTALVYNILNYGGLYSKLATDTTYVYDQKALALAKKLGDKRSQAQSYRALEYYFRAYNHINDSIYFYSVKALKLAKETGQPGLAAAMYHSIGYFYGYMEFDKFKAVRYFDTSVTMYKKLGEEDQVLMSLVMKAATEFGSDQEVYTPGEARATIQEILLVMRSAKTQDLFAARSTLAEYFFAIGRRDTALLLMRQALQEAKEKDHVLWIPWLHGTLASFYGKMGRFKEALAHSDTGITEAIKHGLSKERMDNFRNRYGILKAKGDYKEALHYYVLLSNFKDSIDKISNERASANFNKLTISERRNQEVTLLKKDQELERANAQKQKQLTWFALSGLGLVLVFSFFMVNRFRTTNRQKKLIEQQKKVVEEQKQLVEDKQKEILDSIHYAKRIQTALMPHEKYIERQLHEKTKVR